MQIFLGGTGSLSKWTVSPKEFNRIRFLIIPLSPNYIHKQILQTDLYTFL